MAEHHHQYVALVEFSTDSVVGGKHKIEHYVKKYGEPFSSVLYARYVDRGMFSLNSLPSLLLTLGPHRNRGIFPTSRSAR